MASIFCQVDNRSLDEIENFGIEIGDARFTACHTLQHRLEAQIALDRGTQRRLIQPSLLEVGQIKAERHAGRLLTIPQGGIVDHCACIHRVHKTS